MSFFFLFNQPDQKIQSWNRVYDVSKLLNAFGENFDALEFYALEGTQTQDMSRAIAFAQTSFDFPHSIAYFVTNIFVKF